VEYQVSTADTGIDAVGGVKRGKYVISTLQVFGEKSNWIKRIK